MSQRPLRETTVTDNEHAPGTNPSVTPEFTDGSGSTCGSRRTLVFVVVAFLLLISGWSTNHFSTMLVVLRDQADFSTIVVNGAFGIYALGLVPCLLIGGVLADRIGARHIVLTGVLTSAAGNLVILVWQSTPGLFVGRFVIGLGVGLAMSAGTAWAGRLRGASGVVLAGILLTTGFAVGPIASGILAYLLSDAAAVAVPFLVAIALSCLAVLASLLVGDAPATPSLGSAVEVSPTPVEPPHRSIGRALATSIPVALWVFSTATVALVTLTERVAPQVSIGVLLPGLSACIAFSSGLLAQGLARRFEWGPVTGVVAACIAGAGFFLTGLGADAPPVWVFGGAALLLGTAYGLALREGLLDVEAYAPTDRRGTALGIYYIFTYCGFVLPVLFAWLVPTAGYVMPLVVVGVLAFAAAALRGWQIRRGVLDRS